MTSGKRQPVFRQVLDQAEKTPGRTAIVTDGRSISYGELATIVHARAGTLTGRFGIAPGDRIVLMAEASAEFVFTYLAAHSIGAICVPIDPHIAGPRLSNIVERVTPKLVVAETRAGSDEAGRITFDELAAEDRRSAMAAPARIDLRQTADILFTTGTAGVSKGVVLSHGAVAAACAHINAFIGTGPDAMEVLMLPPSHSFGLGRVRCILTLGATLVLVRGIVSSAGIIKALAEHRATGFASVPAGIAILLGHTGSAWQRLAEQLDYVEIGSSAMPLEQKRELMRRLPNTRICMHYGLTEASRSAYISFHDDSDRLDSIGMPSPGVEMRIVDDAGNEVSDGTQGRIQVRGEHLMSHYWRDAELTAKTLKDGWLDTGDLGRREADGRFYLSARASDIIHVGGRKVAPDEIEAILRRHPDVVECACVGIPDPMGLSGEIISAFLVARPGAETLPKFSELAKLLRQSLESYKIPRRFAWIDALPKSSTGKILRRMLKDAS